MDYSDESHVARHADMYVRRGVPMFNFNGNGMLTFPGRAVPASGGFVAYQMGIITPQTIPNLVGLGRGTLKWTISAMTQFKRPSFNSTLPRIPRRSRLI